jgi:hypothetical protein
LSRSSLNFIHLHTPPSNAHVVVASAPNCAVNSSAQQSTSGLIRSTISLNSSGDGHHHYHHVIRSSSSSLNEKLASIGGLFGLVSIIVTAVLLYAIFTSESQDKWFYIVAVLVNVSLLVLLMIGAILFDRFYLKKYAFSQDQVARLTRPGGGGAVASDARSHHHHRRHHQSQQSGHLNRAGLSDDSQIQAQGRSAPVVARVLVSSAGSHVSRELFGGGCSSGPIDLPPLYPGQISVSDETAHVSAHKPETAASNLGSIRRKSFDERGEHFAAIEEIPVIEETRQPGNDGDRSATASHQHPPNYFDLYPTQSTLN